MSSSHDTRLARLLHEGGRLPLRDLLALLEEARRSQGAQTLAQLLSERGLVAPDELGTWLAKLGPEVGESPRPAWSVGEEVAGLRIEGKLGQGGMGAVYRALDLASGATVAVKTLAASADPEERVRFEREAQAQAAVDGHPNVIRVHRAGVAGGRAFLVMELAGGGDLMARIARGPMALREAALLLRDLARGLSHVHAQGVLHRDLKPGNVVFDERGTPKLADFGLARAEGAETLTQTGTVLGTPSHMAPEQVEGKRGAIGPPTDVYGLGALLYHCLTQSPPFPSGSLYEVLLAVLETRPLPPSERRPGIPTALEALCLRALEKDPALRPASAAAFAEELEAFLAGEAESAATPLWVAALAGFALLLVLTALGLGTLPQPQPQPSPLAATSPFASHPPRARALLQEAKQALVAGQGERALAVIDSALALSDLPAKLREELAQLRSQAQLVQGQLDALPGNLSQEDLPLVRIAQARVEVLEAAAAREELFEWEDLQAQGDLLAQDVLAVRDATPWLSAAIRRQVAEALLAIVFQTPAGARSRELVEDWFREELPRLLGRDDPRVRIARGLFIASRLNEYSGKYPRPASLPSPEGLEPRWQANRAALWLLFSERSQAEPVYAKLALRGPPLFPGSNHAIYPAEVLAQHEVTKVVATVAERNAFLHLEEEGLIDPEAFRIALAHRERELALTKGAVFDTAFSQMSQVRLEELFSCLRDHAAIAAHPAPTNARIAIVIRSRLTRAESALDQGDAPAARKLLETIRDYRKLDYETLFARLEALEGESEAAEARLAGAEGRQATNLVPWRSIQVTREILAGRDPRLALRRALGR